MRKYAIWLLFLLLVPFGAFAQQEVRIGGVSFVPEQNVGRTRGGLPTLHSAPVGGVRNVLVQLSAVPTQRDVEQLKAQGLILGSYLGGNAYYATLRVDAKSVRTRGGSQARVASLMDTRPEWKMDAEMAEGKAPAYAVSARGVARIVALCADNVTPEQVKQDFAAAGCAKVQVFKGSLLAQAQMPLEARERIAALPYVLSLSYAGAPLVEYNNISGATTRARYLGMPTSLEGRGLTGKGVRMGIWDADVCMHPDYGNRIHHMEMNTPGQHGSHVAGTVMGSGLLNPLYRGMAPKVEMWSWNYGQSASGLSTEQEREYSHLVKGITITQNSYGKNMGLLCQVLDMMAYEPDDLSLDELACKYPTMLHVFAGGNSQKLCEDQIMRLWGEPGYGSTLSRSKNALYVGNVNALGVVAQTSSFGPQDDGRLFPLVMARGEHVWSTIPVQGYKTMDGTSMACPAVSGTIALLTERYKQINGNENPQADLLRAVVMNTADDAGRPHPDFVYGYGILNGERAVRALEQKCYRRVEIANGQSESFTVPVPANCLGARVMVAWNDPVSKKKYVWGDKTLVNDVNLTVNGLKPWVLNPAFKKVKEEAVRGEDSRNNSEQVTLTAKELEGKSELTIKLEGKEIPQGPQSCIVTWWFELADDLHVISPCGGETFEPGKNIPMVFSGVSQYPFDVLYTFEASYDNGKSFVEWGNGAYNSSVDIVPEQVQIPRNAPVTDEAIIRLRNQSGAMVYSDKPFIIAPRPERLMLKGDGCSSGSLELSWGKEATAAYGYEVFVVDLENETVKSIGHTDKATDNKFTITADMTQGVNAPWFAVAVRTKSGKHGLRSEAIPGKSSAPIVLTAENPTFVEDFPKTPSPYFITSVGTNVTPFYSSKPFPAKPGYNFFSLSVTKDKVGFDESNFFSDNNWSNIASMEFCTVDLSGFTASADAEFYLHLSAIMVTKEKSPARFRILDMTTKKPLAEKMGGDTEVLNSGKVRAVSQAGVVNYYFKLEPGKNHHLKLEFASPWAGDALVFDKIAVERMDHTPALETTQIYLTERAKRFGKKEKVQFGVINRGNKDLKNVEVRFYVDNKMQKVLNIPDLPALESFAFATELDLSTPDPLGAEIRIRAVARVPEDISIAAAEARTTVINQGVVLMMPSPDRAQNGAPVDPQYEHTLESPAIFTDNGGARGNYTPGQQVTMKIRPIAPNTRIQVTFREVDINGDYAELEIYPGTISGWKLAYDTPTYRLQSKFNDPLTVTSDAEDGSITFRFISSIRGASAPGWIADVRAVPNQNTLALRSVVSTNVGTAPEGDVPISLTYENLWEEPLPLMFVRLLNRGVLLASEQIENVKPGVSSFALKKYPKGIKPGKMSQLTVELYSPDDYDGSDNRIKSVVAYDNYCIPAVYNGPEKDLPTISILECTTTGQQYNFLEKKAREGYPYVYDPSKALECYALFSKLDFSFNVLYKGYLNAVAYIDRNDDKRFEDDEKVEIHMVRPSKLAPKSTGTFNLNVADWTPGRHRMRIIVGKQGSALTPCMETAVVGSVQDLDLLVREPLPTLDIKLHEIMAGGNGVGLSNAQPIGIRVSNNGTMPFKGKMKFEVKVDGKTVTVPEQDFNSKPIGSGESAEIDLGIKADFSKEGKHTVEVKVIVDGDPNTEDNEQTKEVICLAKQNALFTLAFTKAERQRRLVDVDKITGLGDSHTIEMWVYLDGAQDAMLLEAESGKSAIRLETAYMRKDAPDNSLVLYSGTDKKMHTPANSLMPNRWNHIAVLNSAIEAKYAKTSSQSRIFINGEEKNLTELSSGRYSGVPKTLMLKLGTTKADVPALQGRMKMLRVWEGERTADQLKTNWTKSCTDALCKVEYLMQEGFGSTELTSTQGDKRARIQFQDGANALELTIEGPNSVWATETKLISGFSFAGQDMVNGHPAMKAGATANTYTIDFKNAPTATEKGTINTVWMNYPVKYNGAEVNASTDFDFSGGKTVVLTAEATPFGFSMKETVTLSGEKAPSNACVLESLSLKKEHNPGLTEDLTITVKDDMELEVKAAQNGSINDLKKVVLDFTISAGAKLFVNGVEVESGKTQLDGTMRLKLTVIAANGQEKSYTLVLKNQQDITFNLSKDTYTYGDKAEDVEATCSSKRELVFVSSNPAVASVSDGKLQLGTPGTTEIYAVQRGGAGWLPAKSEVRTVTVDKCDITAQPVVEEAEYGREIFWSFVYDELKAKPDVYTMPVDELVKLFDIKQGGKVCTHTLDNPLAVGTYDVVPKSGASLETDLYRVQPKQGSLTVVKGDVSTLDVEVVDEDGNPLSDVSVAVSTQVFKTDDQGKCHILFMQGQYELLLSKTGFQFEKRTVTVQKGKSSTLKVTLRKAKYTITYKVKGEGTVNGRQELQLAVAQYGEGIDVVATPKFKSEFVKWSDEKTEVLRHELLVEGNAEYTAIFRKKHYRVEYLATEGGSIEGESLQMIPIDTDGTEVIAKPATGYYFSGWSDRKEEANRTATAVTADLTVTAIFQPYASLPTQNNFEDGTFGEGWYWKTKSRNRLMRWYLSRESYRNKFAKPAFGTLLDPESMAAMVGQNGINSDQEATLYSTRYFLNIPDKALHIAFDAYNKHRFTASTTDLIAEYALDGGAWQQIKVLKECQKIERIELTIPADQLKGKNFIQLRWRWEQESGGKGKDGFIAFVDNVAIYYEGGTEKYTLTYRADPAGSATFEFVDTPGTPVTQQEVDYGQKPKEVKLIAKAPYVIDRWSDGSKAEVFAQGVALKSEEIVAYMTKPNMITVSYVAIPADGGHFTRGADRVVTDKVDKGAQVEALTAVPADGYSFVRWNDNGAKKAERAAKIYSKDTQIEAVFEKKQGELIVTVVLGGTGTKIQGATVMVGEANMQQTDREGKASFKLDPGKYQVKVLGDARFAVVTEEVEVGTGKVEKTYELKTNQTVAFICTDNGQPMQDVEVTVGMETKRTGADGRVFFEVFVGKIPYAAKKAGYLPFVSTLDVGLGDVLSRRIEMQKGATLTYNKPQGGTVTATTVDGKPVKSGDAVKLNETVAMLFKAADGFELSKVLVNGKDMLSAVDQNHKMTLSLEMDYTVEVAFKSTKSPVKPDPVEGAALANLRIVPNPVLGAARVLGLPAATLVEVYTLQGAKVLSTRVQEDGRLSLAHLPSGVYLLHVGNQTLRFVKQ